MKTLLLVSSGYFLLKALNLFSKPLNQMKMAHIITASKGVTDLTYIKNDKQRLDNMGVDYEDIDIEGKDEDELRKILKDKEVIYVTGGNTSYLLRCVRESGFDKIIKDLINKGIIYIGASAGSYITCPTIEMVTWKYTNKDKFKGKDLTALNLVPFLISVHYSLENKELLQEKIPQSKYSVKILTDKQALLIKDDEVKLIGEGEEIVLS